LLETYETNTYLVWDVASKEAILIDPAAPNADLKDYINKMDLIITKIINTHGHGDHIGGNEYFANEFDCPICIHENDAPMLGDSNLNLSAFMNVDLKTPPAKILFTGEYDFKLGNYELKILHTPGHTKGGVVIYAKPYLFTGDTIFLTDIGRTDLPGGNYDELIKSIKEKVFKFPEDTKIFPGHGSSTSVGYEKQMNRYVNNS
ncbi:MAG: MBL fold metallo-hydrolase, partial [Vagococcus sp.]|jgi:glyoxylase-like metal-dependent hydrolase (beta-lactamase superfamily II)|nr:MBL fold metallo-hydrolase [Vagococcus sp.]